MSRGLTTLEHAAARALSEILHELGDERLPLILTVERVRLSPDLTSGKVYISALNGVERTLETLNHAHHHIQNELAHRMKLRRIPRLEFVAAEPSL
ncbi:MAG: 30S ribosome-binding factor RbfA [Meiothermus sp.]